MKRPALKLAIPILAGVGLLLASVKTDYRSWRRLQSLQDLYLDQPGQGI